VEEITLAANRFRKECINLLLGDESITPAGVKKLAEETVKTIEAGGVNGGK
jgi:hypothetical protein